MKNMTRPSQSQVFNVPPVSNNIPAQTNSYVPESNNNSNGLLVLLTVTTLVGVVCTFYTVQQQNKKFENDFRQRLISTSKEQGKEIKQA